jgi:hypothetical protein
MYGGSFALHSSILNVLTLKADCLLVKQHLISNPAEVIVGG